MTLNKLGIAQEGRMKKNAFILLALLCVVNLNPQVEQHEVDVVNIEVPVWVIDGGKFVDNLSLQDFELYEDGKKQEINALYMIKNSKLTAPKTSYEFTPKTARNFFMLFQLSDFNPRLSEIIDHLFNHVLLPEDNLTLITPIKRYSLSHKAFRTRPKDVIAKEMQSLLRKDTLMGASDYNSILQDLKKIVRSLSRDGRISGIETSATSSMFDIELLLPRYRDALQNLEELRAVDETKLLDFAEQLKRVDGQKFVFFFYQREFRPEIETRIINQLTTLYQDKPEILDPVRDLFQMYNRMPTVRIGRICQAYADASILFHLIFMDKDPENISGINMREQSEDVFNIFSQVALATGGAVTSATNPVSDFKQISSDYSSYYLLVYSPKNYMTDGKFRRIKVILKNNEHKVSHRAGYYAN
jgi:hypothetical protein